MIEITETPIENLLLIKPGIFTDARGSFQQTYHLEQYRSAGITDNFCQDNESISSRGVIRGLHYQAEPQAQSKLVRVIQGAAFDVAVDLRTGSSTYGQWYGVHLDAMSRVQFYIPAGFAHGYLALEDNTIFAYKCNSLYSPEHEGGIRYDDPKLNIQWPLDSVEPIVSEKDLQLPLFGHHKPIGA